MLFPSWETFYEIVGASAGALTGLMFVVIALVIDLGTGTSDSLDAFGSPIVVHFSAALMLSILMTVPWPSMLGARIATASFGLAGLIYMIFVLRRQRTQQGYEPVVEDWIFHYMLPTTGYVATLIAGPMLHEGASPPVFVVGGAAALLMFVGVHNAWDTVIYIVTLRLERKKKAGE